MQPEIEAKFTNINHTDIRQKLEKLGAICEQPMTLFKRITVNSPEMRAKNAWMRVRNEGRKITMTYKQIDELSVTGVKEVEVEVSDFNESVALLMASIPQAWSSYQESKREIWQLDDVEIVLDEWPWLQPYIEIEAKTETAVRDIAAKLDLDWNDAYFGDVMVLYRLEYTHLTNEDTVGDIEAVRFGDELPALFVAD